MPAGRRGTNATAARRLHRATLMRDNLLVLVMAFGIGLVGCGRNVDSDVSQQTSMAIAPPIDLAMPPGHDPGHPPPGNPNPPPPLPIGSCFVPGCHGPNNPLPYPPRCVACHYIPGLPPPPPPPDPDIL
jgi:hypothetical protein